MKKTFRKAIAVLLAVLMVAFSVPFSAFAANFGQGTQITANRKWWVDASVDPSTIKETPTYTGFSELQSLVKSDTVYVDEDNADLRNEYKPVIAVTVSKVGTNAEAAEAVSGGTVAAFATKYYNKYYAASGTLTYDAVKAANNIVNPAELKAGDRIVVTVEFGGFDILCNGQFKGNFDTKAITPAYYAKKPSKSLGDTWKRTDTSTINVNTGEYANTLSFAGKTISGTTGVFTGGIVGQNFTNGNTEESNFFNRDDNTTFGKYGVPSFAYGFEVLKDCDLKDVFHFDRSISGTEFEPYSREALANYENPELFLITGDDTKNTFANWTEIWSEYEKSVAPSTYTITFTPYGGEPTTQTVNAGEMPTIPDNTATTKPVASDSTHHSVTSYRWTPEVVAATADAAYTEEAVVTNPECVFVVTDHKDATYKEAGYDVYTCTENCGNTYTNPIDKLPCDHADTKVVNATNPTINNAGYTGDTVCNVCGDTINTGTVIAQLNGEAYRVALKAAKDVDASKYTADSYAKVTEALAAYDEATVGAYTSQEDVNTATAALKDAVAKLDAGVVVTVASTKLGTTTLNDADATNGANARLAVGDKVVLTAKANNETGEFVGWKVGNKIVSDEASFVTYATADITYEPVFAEKADTSFTVVFVDPYGNVIDTQTVTSGANIEIPTAPTLIGYTFTGWSMTEPDIHALTDGATIYAQYTKDNVAKYTVTAPEGATLTVDGVETASPATVAYDAKVSVHKDGVAAWQVDGVTVAYGDTYTFFCGSDMNLVAVDTAVEQKTTVVITGVNEIAGSVQVSFAASRNVAPGETVVKQGFIYGKNLADSELTLENVGNKGADANAGTVKIAYTKNSAADISLRYGLSKKDGKVSAAAFVITKTADGTLNKTISEVKSYTYH